jgi:hypothetical protein
LEIGPIVDEGVNFYVQNGHVVRIPPQGPLMQIMQQVVAHTEASTIRDTGIRSLTQATALTGLMRHAAAALRALDPIRTPASAPSQRPVKATKPGQPKLRTKPKDQSNQK